MCCAAKFFGRGISIRERETEDQNCGQERVIGINALTNAPQRIRVRAALQGRVPDPLDLTAALKRRSSTKNQGLSFFEPSRNTAGRSFLGISALSRRGSRYLARTCRAERAHRVSNMGKFTIPFRLN